MRFFRKFDKEFWSKTFLSYLRDITGREQHIFSKQPCAFVLCKSGRYIDTLSRFARDLKAIASDSAATLPIFLEISCPVTEKGKGRHAWRARVLCSALLSYKPNAYSVHHTTPYGTGRQAGRGGRPIKYGDDGGVWRLRMRAHDNEGGRSEGERDDRRGAAKGRRQSEREGEDGNRERRKRQREGTGRRAERSDERRVLVVPYGLCGVRALPRDRLHGRGSRSRGEASCD